MRRMALATLAALAPAFAAAQAVTADDVRAACREVDGCAAEEAALGGMCRLVASGKPRQADWNAVAFPASSKVRAARTCKAGKPDRRAVAEGAGGLPTSFSGISQSNVLWGTADFLVGRAEEELRIWAVDRFLRSVCEGPEGKLGDERLFPETCRVAQGTHLRGFLGGMGATRAAMRADIRHLPALAFAAAARQAQAASGTEVDVALVGWQAARVAERLLAGSTALAALRALPEDAPPRPLSCEGTRAAALLHQAAALARVLAVSGAALREEVVLPTDDRGWNAALVALAVNRTSDPSLAAGWPACAPGGSAGFQVELLFAATGGLQDGLERARTAVDEVAKLSAGARLDPGTRLEAYGRVVEAGVGALRAVLPAEGLERQARMLAAAEELARDLAAGSYSAMLVKLTGILAAVWAQKLWPEEFQRVASFAADVAEAQSAEAASAAIARAAEPVGGYRRKRSATGGYVTVNGYFGGSAGLEWAKSGEPSRARPGASLGFWAPVGLELGRASRRGYSYGLLLQAIDLGVLASWRVANDDLASAPEVSARQVFSPGAFLVVGFPRAPVAASLGVAFSPKLRALSEASGAVERERNTIRLGLALGVDIPIFY